MQEGLRLTEVWLLVGLGLALFQAAFVPFLAAFHLREAGTKPMYVHLARQMFHLESVLCSILVLGAGAAWVFIPQVSALRHSPLWPEALTAGLALLVAAIASILLTTLWKKLRGRTSARGLLAAFICLAMLIAWTTASALFVRGWLPAGGLGECVAGNLVVPGTDVLYPGGVVLKFVLLACAPAVAGGTVLVWLLLRRSFDDFGRDYYAFAVRVCAVEAVYSAVLALACLVVLDALLLPVFATLPNVAFPATLTTSGIALVNMLPATLAGGGDGVLHLIPALSPLLALTVCLPLVAGGLWLYVARTAVPMRAKLAMVVAWLCILGVPFTVTLLLAAAHNGL